MVVYNPSINLVSKLGKSFDAMVTSTDISVVIPTMNRQSMLMRAVSSVCNQSSPCKELIVVNNGAKLDSGQPLSANEKIIQVFDIVQLAGASQARNFGASIASGKYVAFLDDDDYWDLDYLKCITATINSKNLPSAVVSRLDWNTNEIRKRGREYELTSQIVFRGNPGVTGSSIIVEKSAFLEIGGFDIEYRSAHDRLLIYELLRMGKCVVTDFNAHAVFCTHENEHVGNPKNSIRDMRIIKSRYKRSMTLADKLFLESRIYKARYKLTRRPLDYLLRYCIRRLAEFVDRN